MQDEYQTRAVLWNEVPLAVMIMFHLGRVNDEQHYIMGMWWLVSPLKCSNDYSIQLIQPCIEQLNNIILFI